MKYDEVKYPWLWKRANTSGYCFTAMIPCRVLKMAGKRVEIAALLVSGAERIHKVKEENLEHQPCYCFGECRGLEKFKRELPVGKG